MTSTETTKLGYVLINFTTRRLVTIEREEIVYFLQRG